MCDVLPPIISSLSMQTLQWKAQASFTKDSFDRMGKEGRCSKLVCSDDGGLLPGEFLHQEEQSRLRKENPLEKVTR